MNKTRRVRIYSEGHDDEAFLRGLERFAILPANVEIVRQSKGEGGASTLFKHAVDFALPVGGLAVVLRDFDDLADESLQQWFATNPRDAAIKLDPAVQISTSLSLGRRCVIALRQGEQIQRIIGMGVGLPEDERLRGDHGVTLHAMDDYLFPLALRADIYEAMDHEFENVPHDVALKKLREVPELLRKNGLVVNQSKRVMQLFRATSGFRASPATFIQRLFDVARKLGLSQGEVRAMALPLADDLDWAVSELRNDHPAHA